jgi:hypothetical protein
MVTNAERCRAGGRSTHNQSNRLQSWTNDASGHIWAALNSKLSGPMGLVESCPLTAFYQRRTKPGTSPTRPSRAQWGNSGLDSVILAFRTGHPPPGLLVSIPFCNGLLWLFACDSKDDSKVNTSYGRSSTSGSTRILASPSSGIRGHRPTRTKLGVPLRDRVHRELTLLPCLRCQPSRSQRAVAGNPRPCRTYLIGGTDGAQDPGNGRFSGWCPLHRRSPLGQLFFQRPHHTRLASYPVVADRVAARSGGGFCRWLPSEKITFSIHPYISFL